MTSFDYDLAFSRNVGLCTAEELQQLRKKRVAIAGMGGVGGYYVPLMARAGVGALTMADIDRFDIVNFNRQYGANMDTVGRPKLDVMAEVARGINPEIDLRLFSGGFQPESVDDFLQGVDLVIDAIDLFEVDAHKRLTDAAMARGIPTLVAAPLGYSAAMLCFAPGGMSFTDFFAVEPTMSPLEKVIQFALGIAPAGLHLSYMDLGAVDLEKRKGPSFGGACMLCGSMVATEAVLLLLQKQKPKPVPYYQQFDARRRTFRDGHLFFGNRGPLQRLKKWYVLRRYQSLKEANAAGATA